MKHMNERFLWGRAAALVAFLAVSAQSPISAQAAEDVTVTQTAGGYVSGSTLTVECSVSYPAGRQLLSLLLTPNLPAGWTLSQTEGGTTGNGQPMVDPDGESVVFLGDDLSSFNPLTFRYTVNVPAGESGGRTIGGTLDYQLDGMPNPSPQGVSALVLTDADATHASIGYLVGTQMTVDCAFSRPAGVTLLSLLWRPELPEGWTLAGVSGAGQPEVDRDSEAIVFGGDLSASSLAFSYTVNVPADALGDKRVGGAIEYQFGGMANPVSLRAKPDRLAVRPRHTLQVGSPYGAGEPAAGIYTNYYGSLLTNRISQTETVGARTWACVGWLLTGNEPVVGTGAECALTLTNNASLAWVWAAPQIGARTVNEMATLSFTAPFVYSSPIFPSQPLSFSLDAASLARGMSITAGGVFSWTPDETQGGQTFSVTATVVGNAGTPSAFVAAETFEIAVAEVNRNPTLNPLSDQLADEQSTLTFTATATDPDAPAQALTFSLDAASRAAGMSIDPASGVFSWTPSAGQAGDAGQSYTVQLTVTDNGANPPSLADTKSFTIGVADSRGTHATAGYLQGRTAEIVCTFTHPAGKALLSLLWRPILPAGWTLVSVAGQGAPEVDPGDETIVFTGAELATADPLSFRYWVSVPAGVTGPQQLRAQVEYQTVGMANPITVPVNPDPLPLPELHTFEVISAEEHCAPAVGIYTNLHGTALSASVSTPFTSGTRTFTCTGWTMTGIEPATGQGDSVSMSLTQDAVLTWNWVAPLIAPATSVNVTMDEDNAPTAWLQPALSASEPYRLELASGLTWSLRTPPAHGEATVTGMGVVPAITYAPSANWNGSDSFEVQVSDGLGGFDHVAVNVTVNPVNDAPVLNAIGDKRTDERTPLSFTAIATDVDVPAQGLMYTMSGAPAGASLDPVNGTFAWTPAEGQAGSDFATFSVTVTVTDDGTYQDRLTDSETFTITLDSSRATHSAVGYSAGQPLTVSCSFAYPATTGRQLQSLLWRPVLPAGWTLVSATGDGDPFVDDSDGSVVFLGSDLLSRNPVAFSYEVSVPAAVTGPQPIGGVIEYQLNGMANPATVRAQPDPFVVPMLVTLPDLDVSDKVYDGLTNATVASYGALAGVAPGHDVQLVTTGASAYFESPTAVSNKVVTVSGLALTGADASWYAIGTQVVATAITQAALTVGGTFTVANKPYDGTTAATISTNSLTLVTPVDGDDVTLNAEAAFESKDVGTGKTVGLSAATALKGAAAGNYTLSLEGAPTATANILFPAVNATQTCDGFRTPSAATSITNSFTAPVGSPIVSLVWRPALPAGWTLVAASGDGNPAVQGSAIVFAGPFERQTVVFAYKVTIPGNEAVTNFVNASAEFGLAGMTGTLTAERLPATLRMRRYHSADYKAPFWVIDSTEVTRFLNYARAGGYMAAVNSFDNYVGTSTPDTANQVDGRHSGDYQLPFWKINSSEVTRLQSLWRAGGYHVSDAPTQDGYALGQ